MDDDDLPVATLGRAAWLRAAARKLEAYFVVVGLPYPARVKFSAHPLRVGDRHRGRIWIDGEITDPKTVLLSMTRELLHLVSADHDVFDHASPQLAEAVQRIASELPPVPAEWAGPRPLRSVDDPRQWR
jgi:hypothetical protein